MRVRFAGATNIGRKRDHNEDSISLPENERLAIVADGIDSLRRDVDTPDDLAAALRLGIGTHTSRVTAGLF